ncbi:MAG TPA: ABC transporter ATP-binding protein [Candidatus Eisenbacteria bacterium]|nr:ABC transporter ATP-binding protein [Candidatus Eisenbacteria bacterium]
MSAHEEDALGRSYDRRLMRRLLGYLAPYRRYVALAIVIALAGSLVHLAGPYLTKEAIDFGIRHRDLGHLDKVALLYVLALVLGLALGYIETQLMQKVGQRIMLDLRMALFRHLQRLPVSYFDRHPVGRVLTRVTNDVDVLNELFTTGLVSFIGDVFLLLGILVAMVQLNAELMGVAFSVFPLIVILTLFLRSRVRRSFRDIRTRFARLNAFLNEQLGAIGTVQILNRERQSRKEFSDRNADHRDANLKAVRYNALIFPVLELIGALAVSLIVWYGGRQVMWTGITLGTLVAFIQYTQRFFRPISDLSEKYNLLQQAMASAERIFTLLDTPPDPSMANGVPVDRRPRVEKRLQGGLQLDHVWFAYRDEDWVLEDVSLEVAPGEKVALVGATGSGKTTIASLLMRFYDPQRGTVRVDGQDLRALDIRAVRSRMGLVLQDTFLFSGTIESNLRLSDGDIAREAIERAVRDVNARGFIDQLPRGFDAEVRERGATLSVGQKQLLAFARTLAADPDVLLLDEATANVDSQTEALIQQALHRLMQGRTSLVIAHRLSTIQNVDRIIVLHHGRVREMGTHAQLLEQKGIYYRLYQLQYFGGRPRRPSAGVEPWTPDPVVGSRLDFA